MAEREGPRALDGLPALMAYWDADLRNAIANVAHRKWYGMTPEQLRGVHLRDVLGEELYEKDCPSSTQRCAARSSCSSGT